MCSLPLRGKGSPKTTPKSHTGIHKFPGLTFSVIFLEGVQMKCLLIVSSPKKFLVKKSSFRWDLPLHMLLLCSHSRIVIYLFHILLFSFIITLIKKTVGIIFDYWLLDSKDSTLTKLNLIYKLWKIYIRNEEFFK